MTKVSLNPSSVLELFAKYPKFNRLINTHSTSRASKIIAEYRSNSYKYKKLLKRVYEECGDIIGDRKKLEPLRCLSGFASYQAPNANQDDLKKHQGLPLASQHDWEPREFMLFIIYCYQVCPPDFAKRIRIPLMSSNGGPDFSKGEEKFLIAHANLSRVANGEVFNYYYSDEFPYAFSGGRRTPETPKERFGCLVDGSFGGYHPTVIDRIDNFEFVASRCRPLDGSSSCQKQAINVVVTPFKSIMKAPMMVSLSKEQADAVILEKRPQFLSKTDITQFDSNITQDMIACIFAVFFSFTKLEVKKLIQSHKLPKVFKRGAQLVDAVLMVNDENLETNDWLGEGSGQYGTTQINCFVACYFTIVRPLLRMTNQTLTFELVDDLLHMRPTKRTAYLFFNMMGDDNVRGAQAKPEIEEFGQAVSECQEFKVALEDQPKKSGLLWRPSGAVPDITSFLINRLSPELGYDSPFSKYRFPIGWPAVLDYFKTADNFSLVLRTLEVAAKEELGISFSEFSNYQRRIMNLPPSLSLSYEFYKVLEEPARLDWQYGMEDFENSEIVANSAYKSFEPVEVARARKALFVKEPDYSDASLWLEEAKLKYREYLGEPHSYLDI